MNSDPAPLPAAEEIAVCAYLIWEQEGRPVGRELDHWLQAEVQLVSAYHHDRSLETARAEGAARTANSLGHSS